MCIDTNDTRNWSPFRGLVVIGVWLALVAVIAVALSSGCGSGSPPVPTTGSISLAWSITNLDHQPTSCAEVGARSVAVRLRNRSGGDVVAIAFPCPNSPGIAQVAPGVYDIAIELHAADGTRLAAAPDQSGVAIAASRVKTLPPVAFAANTKGGLVVSIATSAATNCRPPSTGGAGVTGMTVTLERAAGGCAAVTFTRQLGSTPRGSYTVNCASLHRSRKVTQVCSPEVAHSAVVDRGANCERNVWIEGVGRVDPLIHEARVQERKRRLSCAPGQAFHERVRRTRGG